MKNKLTLLFLILGLLCLGLLIYRTGPAVLFDNLRHSGWGVALVIAVELVVDALNTRGWQHTLPTSARSVPFFSLYCIRQAGVSVNAVTPTAMLGGEVVKAMLLRRYVPLSDGLVSVISAKLSLALGQACFAFVGLAAFFHQLVLSPTLKVALVGVLFFIVAACAVFLRLQRRGMFAAFFRLLDFLGVSHTALTKIRDGASTIDSKLVFFHATQSRDFAWSIGFHFLAQVLGALQIYVLLQWLGVSAPFSICLAIEAFTLLIEGALFFVPGKVGVQEGGKVLIFTALGFTAATGLTVGVAMRLNYLAITVLGLLMLAVLQVTSTPDPDATDGTQPVLHG
jgi:uncharacterized protein (TIRG00374 family)